MHRRTYSAGEVAAMLGMTSTRFYAVREHLHAVDQLPRPVSEIGQLRFERTGIDYWLLRNHPCAPKAPPANDLSPRPLVPPSIEQERDELALVYGRGG